METTCQLTEEALVTAEELFQHPEWNPCELVRGKVIPSRYAGGIQSLVTGNLLASISKFVAKQLLGEVFAPGTGFVLERDPDTVRAPVVSFLSRERIPVGGIPDEFIPIVPDLAVEVLSPSDTWKDVDKKAAEYLRAGVRLVWGVEPRTRCARVYRTGRALIELNESQILSGEVVLPGFELKLSDVF
jgi:Uma2 family endonuclease